MKDSITKTVLTIISTNKGWIIRQALKYATIGGASLTTYLVSKGADASSVEAIVTGLITVATGGLELVFSKLASKIAAE